VVLAAGYTLIFARRKIMKKYECPLCGYVYDPVSGDPDEGISPGTPFEDLPDNWSCPVCGASKNVFFKHA
jgi:rubredoxin